VHAWHSRSPRIGKPSSRRAAALAEGRGGGFGSSPDIGTGGLY
jgi:hypothetical protein